MAKLKAMYVGMARMMDDTEQEWHASYEKAQEFLEKKADSDDFLYGTVERYMMREKEKQ